MNRRAVQPLSLAEEDAADRLIARGRNAVWARQYIYEDRFRDRRSQDREEGGCRRPVSDSLNSIDVNTFAHEANHAAEPSKCLSNGRVS